MVITQSSFFLIVLAIGIYCLYSILSKREKRKRILFVKTGFELLGQNSSFIKCHKFYKLKDYDHLNADGVTRSKYSTYRKFNKGFLIEIIFKNGAITSVTFRQRGASVQNFNNFKDRNINAARTQGAVKNKFGFYVLPKSTLSFHDGYFMVNEQGS
ncbi:hypothetical protein [Mucilaginibacter kameinonensis]|uniref:hypothetical protein n=1 Tax=Mucilaginibacter kameinonensis TaxID=452286 RepID=UPI000EF7F2C9|nr:hypothetical protein [Mucilaginibacter kameinonensis]